MVITVTLEMYYSTLLGLFFSFFFLQVNCEMICASGNDPSPSIIQS